VYPTAPDKATKNERSKKVKVEDVKIGMKVVTHNKTAGYNRYVKSEVLTVLGLTKDKLYPDAFTLSDGNYFNASDFNPFFQKYKFSGYFEGNKTVIYIGKNRGEANYNPADEKEGLPYHREIGLLYAFCRATGISEGFIEKLIKVPKTIPNTYKSVSAPTLPKIARQHQQHQLQLMYPREIIVDGQQYVKV